MSAVTYALPEDYGYVMLGLVGVAFHCTIQGMSIKRYKFLTNEFIAENLAEENKRFKKKYGYDIPKGAYPDMVDGPHASKLPYEDWLEYACAQRAHGNYMEGLTATLLLGAIAGLKLPIATTIALVVYIVGRQLYCSGYRSGPKTRLRGSVLHVPATLALLGMAVYSAFLHTPLLA